MNQIDFLDAMQLEKRMISMLSQKSEQKSQCISNYAYFNQYISNYSREASFLWKRIQQSGLVIEMMI